MDEQDLRKAIEHWNSPAGECLTDKQLCEYLAAPGPPDEKHKAHLITCVDCMNRWRDMRLLVSRKAEIEPRRPVRPYFRKLLRPEYAWAAAAVFVFLAFLSFYQWRGERRLVAELRSSMNQASRAPSPHSATLLELYPDTLVERGQSEPAKSPNQDLVLVLHTPEILPSGCAVELRESGGVAIWNRRLPEKPAFPLTVVIPGAFLKTAGSYDLLIRQGPRTLFHFNFSLNAPSMM
jgi:hypothetical protein